MTFEDRVKTGVKTAVMLAPGDVGEISSIVDRASSRRKKRVVGVLAILALTVAMASPQLFGFTFGSEEMSVTVAGREMTYSEVLSDDPVVVRGVAADAPRFDTSEFGEEVPYVASPLPAEIPDHLNDGGVFAGTVSGIPIFVYGDRVGTEEVFCGTTGGDSTCTDAAAPGGGASTTSEFGPTGDVVVGSIVIDLPAEVSVVVYYNEETSQVIGWQTPVAYTSYMPIGDQETSHFDMNWEFYDADGQRLGTFGVRP